MTANRVSEIATCVPRRKRSRAGHAGFGKIQGGSHAARTAHVKNTEQAERILCVKIMKKTITDV